MPVQLPSPPLIHGTALRREWLADYAQAECVKRNFAALLLLGSADTYELPALLLAAMRSDVPVVVANFNYWSPSAVALAAAGFAPHIAKADVLAGARVAVEMTSTGGPRPKQLLNGFSLANALRAGLAAGGGANLLVHLAAIAREAGVTGFSQIIRVLAPETPAFAGSLSTPKLLALLGDDLHDVETVEGKMLKETLPGPPTEQPAEKHRLRLVRGRASGAEAIVEVPPGVLEIAGTCRAFASEDEAIDAVADGRVQEGDLLVIAGCGVRGGPGLLQLNFLNEAMMQAGVDVPVITDGLAPHKPPGRSPWVSLFSPEAASGGVIGLLRDGDTLRFDLVGGRIRTGVAADDLGGREPFAAPERPRFGYASRYARDALPALEGAGFG